MNASVNTLTESNTSPRRVEGVIRSTQQAAHQAVDQLADGAERLAVNTDRLAHRSAEELRERARHAADGTIVHIRSQPLKSVLIAGAFGAALGVLFTLLGRSRG